MPNIPAIVRLKQGYRGMRFMSGMVFLRQLSETPAVILVEVADGDYKGDAVI
jgi:hypothetical protein